MCGSAAEDARCTVRIATPRRSTRRSRTSPSSTITSGTAVPGCSETTSSWACWAASSSAAETLAAPSTSAAWVPDTRWAWIGAKWVSMRTITSRVRLLCSMRAPTCRASAARRWSSADSEDTQAHPLGVAVVRTRSPSSARDCTAATYSSLLQPRRRHTAAGVQAASWTAIA